MLHTSPRCNGPSCNAIVVPDLSLISTNLPARKIARKISYPIEGDPQSFDDSVSARTSWKSGGGENR